jgi:inner membrane transporter RhtA
MRRPPPHVYFLVSAVFHYLGPAFAVLLFARVDVLGVAWLRVVSAAVVFALGRRPRRFSRLLVAWGCVLAAMNCCFYLAIDRLPLSTVAAIEFLPVVLLAAIGARTPRNAVALALAAPGVLLLTGVHLGAGTTALALAGANAVLFAVYIVLADRVAKEEGVSGVDGLAASMLVAAVVITPMAGWAAVPAFDDPVAIAAGIGVGLCSSVIPYVADQLALARLPRATYALMVSLLPATATVIGIVVLTQVPSAREVAGIALVVAGVALHRPAAAVPDQRKGTRMSRSSSPDGSPRPSRLLVVSQSASPDGSTATVRMRPNSPSSSDSGSPSSSPSTGMRHRR